MLSPDTIRRHRNRVMRHQNLTVPVAEQLEDNSEEGIRVDIGAQTVGSVSEDIPAATSKRPVARWIRKSASSFLVASADLILRLATRIDSTAKSTGEPQ